ncbi:MAG: hypothetical protein NC915_03920 [Candidatus Omnitrophica bacterium]|nr:hypothetical protein [Candidatus Omnitrophota bacterium]
MIGKRQKENLKTKEPSTTETNKGIGRKLNSAVEIKGKLNAGMVELADTYV